MGRPDKIFKGSSSRISQGRNTGRHQEEHEREAPSTPRGYKSHYETVGVGRTFALALAEENEHWKGKALETGSDLEEDRPLAREIGESLTVNSPPRENEIKTASQPIPFVFSSHARICAGCHSEIGHERYLSCMGAVWHPECFRCRACDLPISDYEFSMLGNDQYHKSCYKDRYHPKCDVCKQFIPVNGDGLIEYRAHPFWEQKYCPSHEADGTPRCCSCERMEPRGTTYVDLEDRRRLCLECLDSSIMDNSECQPLFLDILGFYEGLNMKITQQIPLLLVERLALNEAMEGETNGYRQMPETRGLFLSEEQTVTTILRRPKIEARRNRITDMTREPSRRTRLREVTAILILYGLPRLLTGSILAHLMMHAWLQLNGFKTLSQNVEDGICQVLAHMWLESEIASGSGSHAVSTTTSSSSSTAAAAASSSSSFGLPKMAANSHFEEKFGEFLKQQIESDTSPTFGDGFRAANRAVLKYGLRPTLEHIKLTGSFPL